MILIAGIPSEPPIELAIDAAEESGLEYVLLDQRDHAGCRIELELNPFSGWSGTLITPSARIDLSALTGTYARLMDEQMLPDVRQAGQGSVAAAKAASFHGLLHTWLDIAPGRVANRPRAMASNMSKTYQSSIIARCGLATPETLVTNDPDLAMEFVRSCAGEGDEVIYKSVSGARSVVQTFADKDRERLNRIRWCPTQFQRKVRGQDIRVHVVGTQLFAVAISSNATDYRYARQQTGEDAELSAAEVPGQVRSACIEVAAALDLPFCGIDLRRTPDGEYVCFEANPSPAYSYYESRAGVPISRALVNWLADYDPYAGASVTS